MHAFFKGITIRNLVGCACSRVIESELQKYGKMIDVRLLVIYQSPDIVDPCK